MANGLTFPEGLASYGGDLLAIDDAGNELWRINPHRPRR